MTRAPSFVAHLPLDDQRRVAAAIIEQIGPLRLRFTPIVPTPKQDAFLRLRVLDAMFGGAAGGGKSFAILAGALQYVDVPGYSALILRRTFADLNLPGALMDIAKQWLAGTGAKWNANDHQWTFPSGATLTFGYLESEQDKYRYQSAAFQYVGFDELTQFTETSYRYLFSRLRAPLVAVHGTSLDGLSIEDVPLRIRSATNPGGRGHDWVKAWHVDPTTRAPGAVFLPSSLDDNPHLNRDAYRQSLSHLGPAERARLEQGDWESRDDGDVFNRDWLRVVTTPLPELDGMHIDAGIDFDKGATIRPAARVTHRLRWWDLAGTEPHPANRDPDWTAGVRMAGDNLGRAQVDSVVHVRHSWGKVQQVIAATALADGPDVAIGFDIDPGQAGKGQYADLKRMLRGFMVIGERPSGAKETRAASLASAAEVGLFTILAAPWTARFVDELAGFPNGHDDQVDAASGCFNHLWRVKTRAPVSKPTNRIPQRAATTAGRRIPLRRN